MDGRYMDYDPKKPARTVTVEPHDRMAELQMQAALGWVWTVVAEDDGRWSLRHLDYRTGAVGEAEHMSPNLSDIHAALRWADTQVNVWRWAGSDRRAVDQAYTLFQLVLGEAP